MVSPLYEQTHKILSQTPVLKDTHTTAKGKAKKHRNRHKICKQIHTTIHIHVHTLIHIDRLKEILFHVEFTGQRKIKKTQK